MILTNQKKHPKLANQPNCWQIWNHQQRELLIQSCNKTSNDMPPSVPEILIINNRVEGLGAKDAVWISAPGRWNELIYMSH